MVVLKRSGTSIISDTSSRTLWTFFKQRYRRYKIIVYNLYISCILLKLILDIYPWHRNCSKTVQPSNSLRSLPKPMSPENLTLITLLPARGSQSQTSHGTCLMVSKTVILWFNFLFLLSLKNIASRPYSKFDIKNTTNIVFQN